VVKPFFGCFRDFFEIYLDFDGDFSMANLFFKSSIISLICPIEIIAKSSFSIESSPEEKPFRRISRRKRPHTRHLPQENKIILSFFPQKKVQRTRSL